MSVLDGALQVRNNQLLDNLVTCSPGLLNITRPGCRQTILKGRANVAVHVGTAEGNGAEVLGTILCSVVRGAALATWALELQAGVERVRLVPLASSSYGRRRLSKALQHAVQLVDDEHRQHQVPGALLHHLRTCVVLALPLASSSKSAVDQSVHVLRVAVEGMILLPHRRAAGCLSHVRQLVWAVLSLLVHRPRVRKVAGTDERLQLAYIQRDLRLGVHVGHRGVGTVGGAV
mmetsp:Transcript_28169/g.61707  ORF Transcript_28169/g.61707 Transcript_28169/m.61707 type:complete len:232 (+) Transcript_28169:1824-2519(+)